MSDKINEPKTNEPKEKKKVKTSEKVWEMIQRQKKLKHTNCSIV